MLKMFVPLASLVIVMLSLCLPAKAAQDEAAREVNRLWKGRGLQALERYKEVSKGDKEFIEKLAVPKQCAWVLAAAYAYIAVDTNLKPVRRDEKAKTTTYTLYFDADKPTAGSLSVLYKDGDRDAFALGTEALGTSWHVSVVRNSGFDLILSRENCTLGFKLSDPLDATVMSAPKSVAKTAAKPAVAGAPAPAK